jgi:hypothetical protein
MVDYKGGACVLCGYSRCLRALDFHHFDPTNKRFRMVDLKGGRCQLCGYRRNIQVLAFHHVDPSQKRFNFAPSLQRSRAALAAELAK